MMDKFLIHIVLHFEDDFSEILYNTKQKFSSFDSKQAKFCVGTHR